MKTLKETIQGMRSQLVPEYGSGEANAMIRLIFHYLKGWNAADLVIHEGDEVAESVHASIEKILARLARREPIQYILGEAYFYGLRLHVEPGVLIPRPETEELVDMIVRRYAGREDLTVLDIGTGSGAIAIALSRNLPFSKVTAIDKSEKALAVARRNAVDLKAKIDFMHEDVFAYEPKSGNFDIIVSNPPYVDESEKEAMDRNVLDYEPAEALFVPDSDPLLYYRRIAEVARRGLRAGGTLWLEINPRHAAELAAMLRDAGLADVDIMKDMHGRERFCTCRMPIED